MGYCIEMIDCKFFIKEEDTWKCFNALRELLNSTDLRWVDKYNAVRATNLRELLDELRYTPDIDQLGNIIFLRFRGEKLGDDEKIFKVIAPFVKRGSYIEIFGEDGERWRWIFTGYEVFYDILEDGKFYEFVDVEEDFYEENSNKENSNEITQKVNKKRKITIIEDDN